jgi:hypothetical protein
MIVQKLSIKAWYKCHRLITSFKKDLKVRAPVHLSKATSVEAGLSLIKLTENLDSNENGM